jgi:biopolymer transport protein ExbD
MGMSVGGGSGPKSDINMTPLVDVVLVLLIIFMVVTPLLQMAYDVSVPPKPPPGYVPPPEAIKDQIIVSISAENRIYINQDEVTPASAFSIRIKEIISTRQAKMVFFSCDEKVIYADAMKVMDQIRNADEKKPVPVGIILQPVPLS